MNPLAMTVIIVGLLGFFAWSAIRRFKLLQAGAAETRFSIEGDALGKRVNDLLVYVFGQRKMPYYRWAGIAHIMIFYGFMVLLLNTIMLWGRGYDPHFDIFGLLALDNPIGALYAFTKDIFSTLVIIGAAVFVYYRVINVQKRMTLSGEGLLILGIIITMMMADQLYVAASRALEAGAEGTDAQFSMIEPFGSFWATVLSGGEEGTLKVLQHVGFWWHATFVLIFLNILPYSKHFHIITVIPNVFLRNPDPNKLPNIEDLEGKVENEEPIGYVKITDLTWKDMLDLYTCTECGRCSDNCPAYTTDKKLSPKHLTIALRDHLYACEPELFKPKPEKADGEEGESDDSGDEEIERHELHHGDPPEGGYWTTDKVVDLVPNVINPDVIWACTTCRACEEQCPVMISYVDKIVQIRRDLVMMKNEFPGELMNPFNGLETNGNPWNLSAMDRADWADGLDIPTISDNKDADVLYWVGCAASYDDRAKKIARATAQLLKEADVNFAILGTEETCTGDPARRAGNEYLFQMIAEQNVETLKGYEVEKKKIVTSCPHCLNTLANEYPDFGGKFEVVHHTSFMSDLIDAEKLVPKNRVEKKVTFHDSCYLGRYNDVYEAPRKVLESIPGVDLTEVDYWTKNKGLCCGAGGAQMFMEEQNENRVNVKRTLQLLDTGADTIASGCPFCMTMLTDGLKAQEKEDSIAQKDVVELLAESVKGEDKTEEPEAAE
ncbi:MAG: (Fe-S)-binding protein [Myxococcales bacterium]|jgi:Fe-S oxidoreductase